MCRSERSFLNPFHRQRYHRLVCDAVSKAILDLLFGRDKARTSLSVLFGILLLGLLRYSRLGFERSWWEMLIRGGEEDGMFEFRSRVGDETGLKILKV